MDARTKEIRDAIQVFLQTHESWQKGMDSVPPQFYWDVLEDMVSIWLSGPTPAEMRGDIEKAVAEVRGQQAIAGVMGVGQLQDGKLWAAIEQLRQAMTKKDQTPELPYRESVQLLDKQGVGYDQIAKIWGLLDANGRPRVDLVIKELAEPKSVITDDYVHPDDVAKMEEVNNAKLRMQEYAKQYERDTAAAEQADQPCQESSYELWSYGKMGNKVPVSYQQAAKMMHRDVQEVQLEWAEFEKKWRESDGKWCPEGELPIVAGASPTVSMDNEINKVVDELEKQEAQEPQAEQEPVVVGEDRYDPLASKDRDELRELATLRGIGFHGNAGKETLIALIHEHDAKTQRAEN